ncbi:MAG: carbohydrate kinase family protein [Chloroflexi bacterium]|nr:carbohydrate kinase family protein [Chloroflexota bacterium]
MPRILVSGLINIETTLKIDSFPLPYFPVCYPFEGVGSSVSGVGYNIAKALTTLGDDVTLLSIVGQDLAANQVRSTLASDGIVDQHVLGLITETAQSVILYDSDGRRQIHVDLKNIQEQTYPPELSENQIEKCDIAVLCNIKFSRSLLHIAHQKSKIIATDVHAINSLDDAYNQEFMRAADILFMSHERLPTSPEIWAHQVMDAYDPNILVIGLGAQGALLSVRAANDLEYIPAASTRPIVNTIGAGDALFSAFLHSYLQTDDPHDAIRKAVVFASYKIGANGAAAGFLDHQTLEKIHNENKPA